MALKCQAPSCGHEFDDAVHMGELEAKDAGETPYFTAVNTPDDGFGIGTDYVCSASCMLEFLESFSESDTGVVTDAIARELIETMMGRALAVDDDPSEDRPRSFEHAVRLLVPTDHTDHIEDAYEQAMGDPDDGAGDEGGETA